MKRVLLIFPDNTSLAEFILSQRISGVETKSSNASLSGTLTHQHLAIALTKFGAELQPTLDTITEEEK